MNQCEPSSLDAVWAATREELHWQERVMNSPYARQRRIAATEAELARRAALLSRAARAWDAAKEAERIQAATLAPLLAADRARWDTYIRACREAGEVLPLP